MTSTPHPWSRDELCTKARKYFEEMERHGSDDWRFALWSALALELLIRAAVANVSPALLAEQKHWKNVAYAIDPTILGGAEGISANTNEIIQRLQELQPEFKRDQASFCKLHIMRRNAELHSASQALAGLATSDWLPPFYECCDILARLCDHDLAFFLASPETAMEQVRAHQDVESKRVNQDVAAHRRVWLGKSEDARESARRAASTWVLSQLGSMRSCPACSSDCVVLGAAAQSPTVEYDSRRLKVMEHHSILPSELICVACELQIRGYARLYHAGVGDFFVQTQTFDMTTYFDIQQPPDDNLESEL